MRKLTALLAVVATAAAFAPWTAEAAETTATTAGPCLYIIEDAQCIDPTRVVYRTVCPVGEKLGWYCLDATRAAAVSATRTSI